MKWFISHDTLRSDFLKAVEGISGEKVSHCYQCGKCSAGCPIAYEMEYTPNQIIRMVQLGMEKAVLSSNTMWLCASCLTCTVRCPREIDIAEIMDALRRLAYRKKIPCPKEVVIPLFNKIFLKDIELYGRLFEMGLIGMFNFLSGNFFKDMAQAPKMLLKGKISLWPRRARNLEEVRDIFKRAGRLEKVRRERLVSIKPMLANLRQKLLRERGQ